MVFCLVPVAVFNVVQQEDGLSGPKNAKVVTWNKLRIEVRFKEGSRDDVNLCLMSAQETGIGREML